MTESEKEFRNYKRSAIKAARELGYGVLTVRRIEDSKTLDEIRQIMKNAREKYL